MQRGSPPRMRLHRIGAQNVPGSSSNGGQIAIFTGCRLRPALVAKPSIRNTGSMPLTFGGGRGVTQERSRGGEGNSTLRSSWSTR